MTSSDVTEDALNKILDRIIGVGVRHSRTAAKAVIMTFMTATAVMIFTGSLWQTLWIALSVPILSLFATWRRYLEPLTLFVFVLAAAFTCIDPEILRKAHLAFLQ